MAIKALATDDEDNIHLILGLNRSDVDAVLRGDYCWSDGRRSSAWSGNRWSARPANANHWDRPPGR